MHGFFKPLLPAIALSAMVIAPNAYAGCKLVIKGWNYQAIECDRYTPVVSDLGNFTELVKRQVNNPGCFQKLADIVATEYACGMQIYALGSAIYGAYGAISQAGSIAGVISAAGDNQYIIVGDDDGKDSLWDSTANQCKQIEAKVAAWAENDVCIKSSRPKLPASFTNPKPSKVVSEGGTKYIQPLDGSARVIYDGRKYNPATDKCDVYIQGKLQTSTYFLLCDEWKLGDLFHWDGRYCERILNGKSLGYAEPYRCGIKYESRPTIMKLPGGACVKNEGRTFKSYMDDSLCTNLTAFEDAYVLENGRCMFYVNGQNGFQTSPESCGIASLPPPPPVSPSRGFEWVETEYEASCYRVEDGVRQPTKAENYNCGQPSRYIRVREALCSVYVDGWYWETLDRGQGDCPARW